jgi:hypothetical protein
VLRTVKEAVPCITGGMHHDVINTFIQGCKLIRLDLLHGHFVEQVISLQQCVTTYPDAQLRHYTVFLTHSAKNNLYRSANYTLS